MKTNHYALLIAAACTLAAISQAGCSDKANLADSSLPTVKATDATAPAGTVAAKPVSDMSATATRSNALALAPNAESAAASWATIKDIGYDRRDTFQAGLKLLQTKVDDQISELKTKRTAMDAASVNTKEWDFAMGAMGTARVLLRSTGDELGKAGSDTWEQQKERVGQAWVQTQDAYAKVKASTTN
jgi:hypothetical protein